MRNALNALFYLLPVFLVIATIAYGAGTVTVTDYSSQSVKKIVFQWVSDATGDVEAKTTTFNPDGELLGFVAEPGLVSASPTAGYDITIRDSHGFDVLNGAGIDLPQAATTVIFASTFPPLAHDPLVFSVTHCGGARSGTAYLFYR